MGADHRIARDQISQTLFVPALGPHLPARFRVRTQLVPAHEPGETGAVPVQRPIAGDGCLVQRPPAVGDRDALAELTAESMAPGGCLVADDVCANVAIGCSFGWLLAGCEAMDAVAAAFRKIAAHTAELSE